MSQSYFHDVDIWILMAFDALAGRLFTATCPARAAPPTQGQTKSDALHRRDALGGDFS
jgi:hypothetical protein